MGRNEVAKKLLRRFRFPREVMALPKRWREKGQLRSALTYRLGIGRRHEMLAMVGRGTIADLGTYSSTGRPDAIEHIGAEGYGDNEVFGVADTHYIARLVWRKPVRADVNAVG